MKSSEQPAEDPKGAAPFADVLALPDPEYISLATKPLDGSDPAVYSEKLVAPPFSFLDPLKRKVNPLMPAPTYLPTAELKYGQGFEKGEIMHGFKQPDEGGLECVDQEVYDKQKGVIIDLLKQAAKGMFQKGGDFVRISLPARVFEPRSTLDKIIDSWRMAPHYLSKASQATDPVERMKWIITFAVSGLYCFVTNLKPFNPLLGETLEGGFDDGTRIYCEHTSHHPPITNFLLKGDKYDMWGHYNYKVSFSANAVSSRQAGLHHLRFPDGGEVVFKLPAGKFSGLVMGQRRAYYVGEMRFVDQKNGLKAVLIFDYGKTGGFFSSRKKGTRRDDFEGLLYRFDPSKKQKRVKKMSEVKDISSPLSKISGSWLSHIKFGDDTLWSIDAVRPCEIWYTPKVLPSDWRFREDLLWLRRGSIPKADVWKLELEVQQRYDRALREKCGKELAKKHGK